MKQKKSVKVSKKAKVKSKNTSLQKVPSKTVAVMKSKAIAVIPPKNNSVSIIKKNTEPKTNPPSTTNAPAINKPTPVQNSNPKEIYVTINGVKIKGIPGERILDTARRIGVDIPTLCTNDRLERIGACRICVVELEGAPKLVASCTTPIADGMIIKTHSAKVIKARKMNVELLLANHNRDCTTCSQSLFCKLQKYSNDLMISEIKYEGEKRQSIPDNTSVSIRRDNSKCILCGQCVRVCNQIQTVYAINQTKRGFQTQIHSPFNLSMQDSNCVNCGQCVIACPVGALSEKNDISGVLNELNNGKYLIAQTAPSIRVALGECFGMPPGTAVTGKMVSALKEIGFSKVFDTDLAADITIVEEATEFIKRFTEKRDLPMITTCCPAWIKFAEQFYFEQLNHMSSCRSPQAMMASLIKTYYAQKIGKDPKEMIIVDIMPCTAKKFEVQRPEFAGEADYVLTTVELAKLIKQFDINFKNLPETDFDNPLGESTGAGIIFGRSGGVMEAALRTAADFVAGKELKDIEYIKVRGLDTVKEADIVINGTTIKVCAVHTLGEARKIMNQIREGTCPYHFVEIMACYGGCIGGGGQPRRENDEVLLKRALAIKGEDEGKAIRKSHKNPSLIKLYKEYIGEFGGEKAHKLLHTHYNEREFI